MRLSKEQVAEIKACEGVYSVGDVARYYNLSKSTVHDIWTGVLHRDVEPADDVAEIPTKRVRAIVIEEDAPVYLQRGYDYKRCAEALGIHVTTLRRYVNQGLVA